MPGSAIEMGLLASHCITWSLVWQLKDRPIQGKYFSPPARLLKGIHFMSRKSLSSLSVDSFASESSGRIGFFFFSCRENVFCLKVLLNVQHLPLPSTPPPRGKGEPSLKLIDKVHFS